MPFRPYQLAKPRPERPEFILAMYWQNGGTIENFLSAETVLTVPPDHYVCTTVSVDGPHTWAMPADEFEETYQPLGTKE